MLLVDARLGQEQTDVHVAGVAREAGARRADDVQLTAVVQTLRAGETQPVPARHRTSSQLSSLTPTTHVCSVILSSDIS